MIVPQKGRSLNLRRLGVTAGVTASLLVGTAALIFGGCASPSPSATPSSTRSSRVWAPTRSRTTCG